MVWTIAALSSEIIAGSVFPVIVGTREIAVFRDASGQCRAVDDRCAHRRAPLSLGKVTAQGLIECPYHGWRYDGASGSCKTIPNLSRTERVPGSYRIQAYPCDEHSGLVWIGDRADRHSSASSGTELDTLMSGMDREGACLIGYPAALFRKALLNAPSAVLAAARHEVLDSHQLGEPDICDDRVTVKYAVDRSRRRSAGKATLAPSDFPFSLEIRATQAWDYVELSGADGIGSAFLFATVPVGDGLCRVIWRARQDAASGPALTLRASPDSAALFAAYKAAAKISVPAEACGNPEANRMAS